MLKILALTMAVLTTPAVGADQPDNGDIYADWLEVTVQRDPADPRADDIGGDLTPEWGLHLVDINLVLGDLRRLVATQGAAWAAAR